MKTIFGRSLVAIATIAVVAASRVAHAAPPQSVTIVTPPNGAQITVAPGSPVTITANATSSGSNATISSIIFRVDGNTIDTVAGGSSSVSLSTTWQPPAVGPYTIT